MAGKLSDQQKIEIVEKYKSGKHMISHVARDYNVSISSIKSILVRRGVNAKSDRRETHRKYTLNQNYFDVIDDEHKAYWLGWLYSDGYNNEKLGHIAIQIQNNDREILEKFLIDLSSNIPLAFSKKLTYKHKDMCKLTMCSKHMSDRLARLGCPQRKSLILKFPTEDQVPKHLLRHWLRGMWDGDGCISESNKKIQCTIIGTADIINNIKLLLLEELNINSYIYDASKGSKNTRSLRIGGNVQCDKFLNWLYKDSTIYLKRKYDKFIVIRKPIIKTYTAFGESKTITEWSRDPRCVVCEGTLKTRIYNSKLDIEIALSTPILNTNGKIR